MEYIKYLEAKNGLMKMIGQILEQNNVYKVTDDLNKPEIKESSKEAIDNLQRAVKHLTLLQDLRNDYSKELTKLQALTLRQSTEISKLKAELTRERFKNEQLLNNVKL
jgi:hypothetical protein